MSTSPQAYSLRLAQADELAVAIAIDDAAALLFAQVGIVFDFPEQHPFVIAEYARWRRSLEADQLWFACNDTRPIGFFALARAGDCAYLEQLSVHPEHGRRGVGSMLLEAASAHCRERGDEALWLTTYAHVPWNKPFYEQRRFRAIPELQCNSALRALLAEQREFLPAPDQRIAMMRTLA